ncbi:MAG: hypothetical protein KDA86_14155 [Planctomycetaceae bacterium]|nr:hypothetical protein [Planctomycetaceae bacterium]
MTNMLIPLLAAGNNAALVTFLIYMVGVFVLAWAANRLLHEKEFLSEYFLGSRGLGVWAFALTFAATSASGGSFTGFPARIYTHGWILALWIASYMVVPICGMGLLGKRINQVARKAGAITVPDILRERYDSPAFGLISTTLIVFFMAVNLVAQFKAGSVILQTLVGEVEIYQSSADWMTSHMPAWGFLQTGDGGLVDGGYLLCLLVFGIAVVIYTTYGGFHAVVWTDVMQGLVMVGGVLIMLPLALYEVGGLENATRRMANQTLVTLEWQGETPLEQPATIKAGDLIDPHAVDDPKLYRILHEVTLQGDEPTTKVSTEVLRGEAMAQLADEDVTRWDTIKVDSEDKTPSGDGRGAYVTGPGPDPSNTDGFLPFGVAISFFFMWAISGSGQPQYMVRLMAFKDTKTLRRSIVAVTIYYSLIYFPLVIIFCCARILMPGMEAEADSIMPKMAVYLTENIGMGWLAGLLVAAPFAAVMSTVDSFLLVVSSALVRDVYQRNVNPDASEKTMKWLSYLATLAVGLIALIGAINPPQFLQDIIVYVGSGLAAAFLFPVAAMLYWQRSNVYGCLAGMLGGFGAHLAMHILGWLENGEFISPYLLFGFSPVVIGLAASLLGVLLITPITPAPPEHLVRKYFYKSAS